MKHVYSAYLIYKGQLVIKGTFSGFLECPLYFNFVFRFDGICFLKIVSIFIFFLKIVSIFLLVAV
jgi:hypothetical protein